MPLRAAAQEVAIASGHSSACGAQALAAGQQEGIVRLNAATAYHEAGHAVAALAFNFPVSKVTIVPILDCAGIVTHASPLAGIRVAADGSDRARLRTERAIIVLMAGTVAQRRHSPRSVRRWHSAADYAFARDLAVNIASSEDAANACLRWLQIRTRDLMIVRWNAVAAVAEALLQHYTVGGADLIPIVKADQKVRSIIH